jgi:DNA polymerase
MDACRPWWERELDLVRPRLIGLLGATAAQAVLGRDFRLTRHRGEWFDVRSARATATVHPSAVLRAGERRAEEYDGLVRDLSKIAAEL